MESPGDRCYAGRGLGWEGLLEEGAQTDSNDLPGELSDGSAQGDVAYAHRTAT